MNWTSYIKQSICAALIILGFLPIYLAASGIGKIELAPAYIHLDVIEAKNTIKELDMAGIRGDFCWVFENGWMIKPSGIYGKENDGELVTAGIAIGRCIPIGEKWIVIPSAGISYTAMETTIPIPLGELGVFEFREHFTGHAPYASLDVTYIITPNLRISGCVQYAWSRSKTTIEDLGSSKSSAEGPNVAAQIEYDLNKSWSVNFGGAYNESYSKEKNGIRGRGLKIGLVRWF